MGKRAALRYCGGCNPRYERGTMVRSLQDDHPNVTLEVFSSGQDYAGVLVVCGCTAQCAERRDLPADAPHCMIATEQDYQRAAAFLSEL